jgi:hypothetical protein
MDFGLELCQYGSALFSHEEEHIPPSGATPTPPRPDSPPEAFASPAESCTVKRMVSANAFSAIADAAAEVLAKDHKEEPVLWHTGSERRPLATRGSTPVAHRDKPPRWSRTVSELALATLAAESESSEPAPVSKIPGGSSTPENEVDTPLPRDANGSLRMSPEELQNIPVAVYVAAPGGSAPADRAQVHLPVLEESSRLPSDTAGALESLRNSIEMATRTANGAHCPSSCAAAKHGAVVHARETDGTRAPTDAISSRSGSCWAGAREVTGEVRSRCHASQVAGAAEGLDGGDSEAELLRVDSRSRMHDGARQTLDGDSFVADDSSSESNSIAALHAPLDRGTDAGPSDGNAMSSGCAELPGGGVGLRASEKEASGAAVGPLRHQDMSLSNGNGPASYAVPSDINRSALLATKQATCAEAAMLEGTKPTSAEARAREPRAKPSRGKDRERGSAAEPVVATSAHMFPEEEARVADAALSNATEHALPAASYSDIAKHAAVAVPSSSKEHALEPAGLCECTADSTDAVLPPSDALPSVTDTSSSAEQQQQLYDAVPSPSDALPSVTDTLGPPDRSRQGTQARPPAGLSSSKACSTGTMLSQLDPLSAAVPHASSSAEQEQEHSDVATAMGRSRSQARLHDSCDVTFFNRDREPCSARLCEDSSSHRSQNGDRCLRAESANAPAPPDRDTDTQLSMRGSHSGDKGKPAESANAQPPPCTLPQSRTDTQLSMGLLAKSALCGSSSPSVDGGRGREGFVASGGISTQGEKGVACLEGPSTRAPRTRRTPRRLGFEPTGRTSSELAGPSPEVCLPLC